MKIALVVLDTLRKDAFDEHFDWLAGHRFEQAWAPGNWTVPVHGSLFTGQAPAQIGVHAKHQTLDCQSPTLAEVFSVAGYRARGFSANPNVSPVFQFDRGFDDFRGSWRLRGMDRNVFDWETFITEHRDRGPRRYLTALREVILSDVETAASLRRGLDIKLRDVGLRETPDDDGAQEAISFVEAADFDDDEFLFLNLMEAHAPYDPPASYHSELDIAGRDWTTYNGLLATIKGQPPAPATAEMLQAAYNDSVRYLADVYAQLHDRLCAEFDFVITLGDHGELFGAHDTWQHAYGLHPELTHVPLVVTGEAVPTGSTDAVVSLTDVFHTVTTVAGLDAGNPARSLFTTDLEPRVPPTPAYTEYHGVSPRNRAIVAANGHDVTAYDEPLFGAVDAEARYGYQTLTEFIAPEAAADTLQSQVEAYAASVEPQRPGREETEEVPESVRRHLEDLGYA